MNKAQPRFEIDRDRWSVLALAVVVYLIASAAIVPFVPDDSYISFRYAEHLADGNGLRFNGSDSPVEGYSNFLWIGALAVVDAMGFTLPSAAPALGFLFGVLTLGLLWLLLARRRVGASQMILPLLLAASAGPFVIYAVSGLETPFFAFMLLLTLLGYENTRESGRALDAVGLGFVGFLTALCRPEGVVALPVVIAVALLAQRGRTDFKRAIMPWLVGLAVFMALYLVYTIWRVNYFGGLWPTPFLSKGVGGAVFAKWIENLRRYFVMQGYEFPPVGYYFAALVVLGFFGVKRLGGKGSVESVALILGLAYVAVYFNFLDWMPGMRYHAGIVPLFFLPLAHVGSGAFGAERDRTWRRRFILVVVCALAINALVLTTLRMGTKRLEEGNQLCLKAIAEWIVDYTPADWRIAISDVGAVPYYSGRYTIDIHPESLTDLHIARNGWDAQYVLDKKAEIILLVARGVFSPRMYPEHFAMAQSPQFSAQYRFIGTIRIAYTEDRCYWMFVKRDWPPLSDAAFEAFPPGIGSMRRVER